MSGAIAALAAAAPGGATLDTQTVTTGSTGSGNPNFDRRRGFDSGVQGSISDGTSNIFGGAAITKFYWDETTITYVLAITGATNSGWTQVTIDGTKVLTRASATFSAGTWTWATSDTVTTQAFSTASSNHTCVFT